ncbi:hypothetical protein Glove_79g6 [Diversispora epigaea]|uniref:Protein kinase domain-containing protein n=1 Tax=Diversispora epigaea TaxID=1348612 RepID=A0A397J889_9GLOM|nr:hypothetical protein Glove_79g6 [Diversispora epigaea]
MGLMHKDFHSGNIVNQSLTLSYITDFGLCKPVTENNPENIYGVIPYMAPETLSRGEYTQASDIYSFGMVMLEVLTSYPPYYNIPHDVNLVIKICEGLKPEIKCEIPQFLKEIMEKCWNFEPLNRPTAEELKSQLEKYLSDDNEIRKQVNKQINVANKSNKNFIQYDPFKMHPEAIYTSRLVSKLTKLESDEYGNSDIEMNSSEELVNDNIYQPIESFLINEDLLKDQADINTNASFNCIQFNKPQITINNEPNIWSEPFGSNISNFFSIESNVYFGTSAASHAKVEKLINLLINKKNEIDKMLESQPAYIIEPDFQAGFSAPRISCWVTEPLDISILEKLENLFNYEFEVLDCVMTPVNEEMEEENSNGDNDAENSGKQKAGNGKKENNAERNDKNGKRTSKKKQNNKKKSNKNSDSDNDSDSDDSYYGDDNELSETIDPILISSEVIAKVKDTNLPDVFQEFKISAYLWVDVYPDTNETHNLKFSINVNDCRTGEMLSEKWPSLRKLGIGYFLDSVEIWVTPIQKIQNESIPHETLYIVKNGPLPPQPTKDVGITEILESFRRFEASIKKDPGINVDVDKKYQFGLNYTTNEWKLNVDGGAMSGFRVTITQVLRCKTTDGWRRHILNTGSKLIQQCSKMAHAFEITFNSLENFNKNFENLRKCSHDCLNVTFEKNTLPTEDTKNSNIDNIERSAKKR